MAFDLKEEKRLMLESIQKSGLLDYLTEDDIADWIMTYLYGSPDMKDRFADYYDKILSGDDKLAAQIGLDPKKLKDARWSYTHPDNEIGYDGPDIDKQVEALEARAAQEEAEDAAKEAQAQKTESFKDSFDINAAMASRDQSYSAEPVQRAAHEPFQRMGLFGRRDYAVAASEPTAYQKMSGDQAIAKFLVENMVPETDEEKAEEAEDTAKPAEARLDQPDARDSSS